jgi:DNA-binding NtrC family response regulator
MVQHILVVEDDASVLQAFIAALPEFRLTVARDAYEALAAASHVGWLDLIITDYLMPTIPGDELIARVRERHPRIKALIVTGHGDILDREAPDWWTHEAHLTKPFDATTLRRAITNLIGPTSF